MTTEKRAAAYLRNARIFLHPDSKTSKGIWLAREPIVASDEKDGKLGEKVLQVLARSTDNVPHPASFANSDTSSPMKALIKAAAVRSYEVFADSTKCVGIMQNEDGLVFTPSLNGGFRRRFLYLKTRIHSRAVPSEVAAALMAAFDACTEE